MTTTTRYTRCDHGQWLQDGPCDACDARSTDRGFTMPDFMRERLSDMATELDELRHNVGKANELLSMMAQATDRETFETNANAYAMLAAILRIQVANL